MIKTKSKKSLVKKKAVKPKVLDHYITIMMDASSSMSVHRAAALKVLNSQLETIAEEAKKQNGKTYVRIGTFNDTVSLGGFNLVDSELEADQSLYQPSGWTALYDGIRDGLVANHGNREAINNLIVITDGAENKSNTSLTMLSNLIRTAIQSDVWTIAACVPPGHSSSMTKLDIPAGCIMEWETTADGFNKVTKALDLGMRNTFALRTAGITNSNSVGYFSPDLNSLTKTEVKRNLTDVTNRFHKYKVNSRIDISTFMRQVTGMPYTPGQGYYQLTKAETVQDYKAIVVEDNANGKLYTGPEARELLGLPSGGTIELNPNFNNKWTVYVRSTSWNRKLVPGTNCLYQY